MAKLPGDARRLLLLAAADPVGDTALVWRAAQQLGIPESAAETVEAEGLLELGARVVFRHPLVRSAVYRAAGLKERRAVHRALAEATDPVLDPDRRAWHRAQAASMPDEDVAAELERSAGRAQARGGLAAVAAFLERAAALTPESDPPRAAPARGRRCEARCRRSGGCARAVGRASRPGALDELGRARVELLRAQIAAGAASRRRRRPPVSERGESPRTDRPRAGPRDLPRGARGRHGQRSSRSTAGHRRSPPPRGRRHPAPFRHGRSTCCSTRSRSA